MAPYTKVTWHAARQLVLPNTAPSTLASCTSWNPCHGAYSMLAWRLRAEFYSRLFVFPCPEIIDNTKLYKMRESIHRLNDIPDS